MKLYLRWYILVICSYSSNERIVFFIKKMEIYIRGIGKSFKQKELVIIKQIRKRVMKGTGRKISKMYMELRNGQKEVVIKESMLMGIRKGVDCCCLKEMEDMKESSRMDV